MLFQTKETRTIQREEASTEKIQMYRLLKKKLAFHFKIDEMDGTKRQNWIKQRERKKKATHTKKTKSPIHSKTQPEVADSTKKNPSQSTGQNTFPSYYLSQSNFLLVY